MKTNITIILIIISFINPYTFANDPTRKDIALSQAVRSNDLKATQSLLLEGANPNTRNWCKATPLHNTSKKAVSSITQLLLSFGADPNAQDMRLNTPLHYAVRAFSKNSVMELLDAGAHINAENSRGESALFLAVKKDAWQLIPILIERGASLDVTDSTGTTLLEIAAKRSIRTRKALVTCIAPQEVQHVIPAFIALTNPCNDQNKKTVFGKDLGLLIARQLIPEIIKNKLTLGTALMPRIDQKTIATVILQNIKKMILKAPRIAPLNLSI